MSDIRITGVARGPAMSGLADRSWGRSCDACGSSSAVWWCLLCYRVALLLGCSGRLCPGVRFAVPLQGALVVVFPEASWVPQVVEWPDLLA